MGISDGWQRFGREHPGRRIAILALVDFCVSLAVASAVQMKFGVHGIDDSNPPTCSNYFGDTVDCSRENPVALTSWLIFAVLFTVPLAVQIITGRRQVARARAERAVQH